MLWIKNRSGAGTIIVGDSVVEWLEALTCNLEALGSSLPL